MQFGQGIHGCLQIFSESSKHVFNHKHNQEEIQNVGERMVRGIIKITGSGWAEPPG